MTRNRFEAEELAQDAFLAVYERWDRVRGMEDPTGYLYRTAMNGFRSWHRRSALARETSDVRIDEPPTGERPDLHTAAFPFVDLPR